MSERARPVILPGGDYVIPGTGDTLGALVVALRPFRSASPRVQRLVDELLAGAEEALIRSQDRAAAADAAACASPSPAMMPVVAPAQLPAASQVKEIGTAEAAAIAGKSPEWARQLASGKNGKQVGGRKVGPIWVLNEAAFLAYIGRSTDGIGSGKAPSRHEGEGTGTGSPGGRARGGPAAA